MGLFSKRLGESPVPGEATIALPAGKVKIDYVEAREGRELDGEWPGPPAGLEVSVRPAGGGDALTITEPRMNNEFSGRGRIGSRIGHIEVPAAGEFVVTVPPFDAGRQTFEPRISFKG
jgi:hypothetical protein